MTHHNAWLMNISTRKCHSWGRGLILIAGGDRAYREWTRNTLESEGYAVLAATDAVAFMELMVRYRSIVRMVVCGPTLSGNTPQHLVQLVRDNVKGNVPVVVQRGDARGPNAETHAFDACLTVPLDASRLISIAGDLVQRQSEPSAGDGLGSRSPLPTAPSSAGASRWW